MVRIGQCREASRRLRRAALLYFNGLFKHRSEQIQVEQEMRESVAVPAQRGKLSLQSSPNHPLLER